MYLLPFEGLTTDISAENPHFLIENYAFSYPALFTRPAKIRIYY